MSFTAQLHYSTETASMIPWHLDSDYELDRQGRSHELTTRKDLRQPWRSYWPPKSKAVFDLWLRSEHPEVLSWRFDRTQPFDRPWRVWTRTFSAQKEKGAVMTGRMLMGGNCSVQSTHRVSELAVDQTTHNSRPIKQSETTNYLDEKINQLKLPFVVPESFPHLVPLARYLSEKPYLSRLPCLPELKRTNIVTRTHPIPIFDVSGNESFFKLDESGFEFAKSPIRIQLWNDLSVVSEYIPRLKEWLQQRLKCLGVFVYAYNVSRKGLPINKFRGQRAVSAKNTTSKTPFLRAHCDATADSCFKRLQLYFPNEAQTLMKGRVRFLNIWRPISTPVQDCPLAFCDYRTIQAEEDLVPADMVFPHYRDEAYEVKHSPTHRWFYKKGMEWDDVLLFKLGDNSKTEAPLCPHSAFMDPSVPKDTPSRVSLEVRVIVFG